jgi:hypothetical protein
MGDALGVDGAARMVVVVTSPASRLFWVPHLGEAGSSMSS